MRVIQHPYSDVVTGMEPRKSANDLHDSAASLFDIAAGVVGTMFLALTLWAWCLGEMVVNEQRVRYPDPTYLWAIAIGTAIGISCWVYAGFRYWFLLRDSGSTKA